MAAHSSVLAWRIPGTEEPGGLPSMGSHRVGHDWSDLAAAANHSKLTRTIFFPYIPTSSRAQKGMAVFKNTFSHSHRFYMARCNVLEAFIFVISPCVQFSSWGNKTDDLFLINQENLTLFLCWKSIFNLTLAVFLPSYLSLFLNMNGFVNIRIVLFQHLGWLLLGMKI